MLRQIAPEVFQIPLMPRNSINCYIIEGVLIDSGIRSSYTTVKKLYGKSLLINIYLRMHTQTIRAVAIRYALNSEFLYYVIPMKFSGLKPVW
jgi:hypothetical protein